jgi:DNA-3-methyladenine glycosylase I
MEEYHDKDWGTPVHDDQLLFEHLALDGFQAGLSWRTILNKRDSFRLAFDGFHIEKVSSYNEVKIKQLLDDPGIIRNRLKIEATINNAKQILRIQEEFNSFDAYIWGFSEGKTIQNTFADIAEIPASTPLSDTMSKDLKKRGFKFTGTTICYAFMQAVGIVNDHLIGCFRHQELSGQG